ncbi:MAG: repeat-containing protein [Bacteroidetes bacterium]|nr:repeat-containing protein [Bacteroidota bacterium]
MFISIDSRRWAALLQLLRCALWTILFALSAGEAYTQDMRVAAHGTMTMEDANDVAALAFSGNGNLLLSGDVSGRIQCWDLARRVTTVSSQMENAVLFLAFLANDQSFVAVDERGAVVIFDLLKGAAGTSFTTKGTPVRVAVDAGKRYLAVANSDEQIELFDLKAEVGAGTIKATDKLEDVLFLGFDRLGQQIVAVLPYGDVHTWNPSTLKPLRSVVLAGGELHGSRAVVHAAATNRATNVFAVSLEEVALPKGGIQSGRDLERRSMLIAYDWASGDEIKRVKIPTTVERMAMGPGNDHLAVSGDDDNTITLVDLRKGEQGSVVTMTEAPRVLAVSDDNRWLAGGGKNGVVAVWSLQFKGETGTAASSLPSLSGRIRTRGSNQPALKEGEPVKMAILSFEGKGVPAEVADITLSSVSNALANFDYITLVERKQIETILKEQQFQLSGLTEEEGVSVGKILKADVVLLGSVGKLGSSLVFSARLISVETGKVMKGREVICEECRDQDIYDAINMLVSTIAR